VGTIRNTKERRAPMFDPNDLMDYKVFIKEQEPSVEEMPTWLASFFDDDEYDIFSK
jgi:hypothetical protein